MSFSLFIDSAPPPDSTPPPPPTSASPPPTSASPPPISASPPPPESSPPPPPEENSSSPPPPASSNNSSPPSPPPKSNNNNNSSSSPPPPPTSSGVFSPPPPPKSSGSASPPPPPAVASSDYDTSTSSDSSAAASSSLSNVKQLLIGASVGLGLFLLAMVVVCMLCAKRKKRKRDHEHLHYYSDHSHGRKEQGMYYNNNNNNNTQVPNWHMAAQGSAHGGWPPQPPPPPPPPGLMMSSGEMGMTGESGNFSGTGPRQHNQVPVSPQSPGLSLGFSKSTFTYDELAAATGGFSQVNLLGQGGFGYVHKGVLPNGKEVAVKSLKSGSGQGEREFQAEVEIISRVHHKHLVSLVGYCIAGGQRMLVYDFVRNNTLEHHLYGKDLPTMDWPTRLRIATGSAKGLAYLHEDCHPRIIHRDIKTANILLDNNFEAMVADFGLAKLSSDNYTHVSTRVMGTFGYLAPEYASSGKLTEKSDVFSYGVMLLELITGRRPVDPTSAYMEDSLVDWARPLMQRALEDGVYDDLVDPRLDNNFNPQEMARMVASAAASIRHSARKRPKMSQIVRALEGDVSLADLNEGVKPGQSSIYTSSGSSEYDMNAYNADMKKFRQVVALTSQEFGESDFGTSSNDSREMTNHGNQKQQL